MHDSIIAACGRAKGLHEVPTAPHSPVAVSVHGVTEAVFVQAFKPPVPVRARPCGPLLPEPPVADAADEVASFSDAVCAALARAGSVVGEVGEGVRLGALSFPIVDEMTQAFLNGP